MNAEMQLHYGQPRKQNHCHGRLRAGGAIVRLMIGLCMALLACAAVLRQVTGASAFLAPVGGWLATVRSRSRGALNGRLCESALDTEADRSRSRSAIPRLVAMDPPTRLRPPDVDDEVDTGKDEWAECIVSFSDAKRASDASEVWVFRKKDYEEFQRLIGLRLSYRPAAPGGASAEQSAASRFGAARRAEAMAGTQVTCRDRSMDPEIQCAQCVRVFTGGAYKDKAISVPAFPAQPLVLGCLALSLGEEGGIGAPEGAMSAADWPLRQTAFCNSVNARFSTVSAE
mmetsp:Transcript_162194/g.520163  ORF Transcript_162194/g.520163 Transcript_162194/m.520163 type:complete len:285 (+) Transcript_162194:89-943(+)